MNTSEMGGILVQDVWSTNEIALVRKGCVWEGYAINCPCYVIGTQECDADQQTIAVQVDRGESIVYSDNVTIYCGKA